MSNDSLKVVSSGMDPGGGYWDDRPPKTYESNFIHHDFAQFEKQHSRYKAILPSTAVSRVAESEVKISDSNSDFSDSDFPNFRLRPFQSFRLLTPTP